jgi:hypothetical protein
MAMMTKATKVSKTMKVMKAMKKRQMALNTVFTKSWSPVWIGKFYSWRLTSIVNHGHTVVEKWAGRRLPAVAKTAMKAKKWACTAMKAKK